MTERDKLWAFLALLGSIVIIVLAIIVSAKIGLGPALPDGVFKISDAAIGSFATVLGAAGLAMFRTSQATTDMASALKTQAETAASVTPPTAATVLQPGEAAVAAPVPDSTQGA